MARRGRNGVRAFLSRRARPRVPIPLWARCRAARSPWAPVDAGHASVRPQVPRMACSNRPLRGIGKPRSVPSKRYAPRRIGDVRPILEPPRRSRSNSNSTRRNARRRNHPRSAPLLGISSMCGSWRILTIVGGGRNGGDCARPRGQRSPILIVNCVGSLSARRVLQC